MQSMPIWVRPEFHMQNLSITQQSSVCDVVNQDLQYRLVIKSILDFYDWENVCILRASFSLQLLPSFLVFRKKDLYLVISQKFTFMKCSGFHEIQWISPEIHPKPYKIRCFNKNSSVWGVQGGGYEPGFHEILCHSPSPAFIKLNSFG